LGGVGSFAVVGGGGGWSVNAGARGRGGPSLAGERRVERAWRDLRPRAQTKRTQRPPRPSTHCRCATGEILRRRPRPLYKSPCNANDVRVLSILRVAHADRCGWENDRRKHPACQRVVCRCHVRDRARRRMHRCRRRAIGRRGAISAVVLGRGVFLSCGPRHAPHLVRGGETCDERPRRASPCG